MWIGVEGERRDGLCSTKPLKYPGLFPLVALCHFRYSGSSVLNLQMEEESKDGAKYVYGPGHSCLHSIRL